MESVEIRAKNSGFTIVAEAPTCWYALLPGETKFRHVEKRDSEDEMNYIGFFHSKPELLAALARILEGNLYNIPSLASHT
jgi:hypothetical protein